MERARVAEIHHDQRMPRHVDLPVGLQGRAFSVAEAQGLGIGRGRLEGNDLSRPHHGIRSAGELPTAVTYAPLLRPGDRFSHTTAARIWGAPLPREREDDLHVTARVPASRPKGQRVEGHRDQRTTVRRRGLPVSDPVRTIVECASVLALDDLVAVVDHLVLDPRILDPLDLRPYVELADLCERLGSESGRGIRLARQAAGLARGGVESPMETYLRLLLTRAGIPDPLCGFELTKASGRTIGWFDLAWPEFQTIAEYDGDGHRTSTRQYDRDIRRFDLADDLGWKVIRVRAAGLESRRSETVERVRTALAQRGWTPRRPKTISGNSL